MRANPHIMLHSGAAEAAIALWQRAFPDLTATPPQGAAGLWHLQFAGQKVTLFDSPQPHEFAPTPSWSFLIDVDTPDEIDGPARVLAEGGQTIMPLDTYDFAERFTWIEDALKISWQLRFGAR